MVGYGLSIQGADMTELIWYGVVIAGYIAGFGMMGFFSKSRPKSLKNTRYEL